LEKGLAIMVVYTRLAQLIAMNSMMTVIGLAFSKIKGLSKR